MFEQEGWKTLLNSRNFDFTTKKRELRLADLGKRCVLVPPSTLEKVLNKMYRTGADIEDTDDFSIEFNFDYFEQSEDSNFAIPETWYIWLLSQSKPHQDLIMHPVIEAFMDTKWSKVRSFYYFDVVCQIVLALLWTIYSITDTAIRFSSNTSYNTVWAKTSVRFYREKPYKILRLSLPTR